MKYLRIDEKVIAIVAIILPVIIIVILSKYIDKKEEKQINYVIEMSKKYKELIALNNKYTFNDLSNYTRVIKEKEYSHKAYDRARAIDILTYYIENNECNIREFILNAFHNKKLYNNYLDELSEIMNKKNELNFIDNEFINEDSFYKIEKSILDKNKINESIYNISIDVIVEYITSSGQNIYRKNRVVGYEELCSLYRKWYIGKKYIETSKRERRYMNDKLRYDILKRDNFKCKKCGMSADDGAKLHVDHIIPISKGGKTTPSNLQTLCDRCNIGKSNKEN